MAEQVHVGEGGSKSKARRWLLVLAVIAAVIAAAGAGILVRSLMDRKESVVVPDQMPAVIQDVQNLALQGKQDEADRIIEQALQDPATPPDVKFTLYSQQGANYYEKGEYQKALDSYTNAFKIRETFEMAQAIATTWIQLGDKQQAIDFYRKAIELMPQDNPVRDDDIQLIEEQIKALEAGL